MNILFVNATKSWGGIKTWMLELAGFLSQREHDVALVCRENDLLITECAERNLTCYPIRFGTDFSPGTIRWFFNTFKTQKTEVVITNISKGVRTAGVAAKLRGVAHVNRLGNYRDLKNSLKSRLLYTLLVDKVFVPSQALLKHFARYDFLRLKLRAFPNAVIPPPFAMPHNSPVRFAIVAKLSKRKQVHKVLQAFSHTKDLPWELHVGGFGPELANLKKLSQELQLEQRVHFTCQDDSAGVSRVNPYEFLKDKDVGILYSTREGFPFSLVEYMALSCAVIASGIDGIPEIITHNADGLLVDPHNIDELEQAIRLLVNNPQHREELIRKGYKKVQYHFHQETVFARVEEEIRQTIIQAKSSLNLWTSV